MKVQSVGSRFVQRAVRRCSTSRKAESSTSRSRWADLPTQRFLRPRF